MAKTIGMLFGWIYTIVGIAGFIPALGGSFSMTGTTLLGVAQVNVLHNIVHLIIGIAGLSMSRTEEGAGTFCKTFGIILLLIGIIGFIQPNLFGILPIGGGDIWIHLITGAILAVAGFATAPSRRAAAS
ncbi:MAG TPA: DUF4383 domain-containing protein [Candidatus Eremiobacteraceae bacterium]|nr:DUF4383 domain-containing protein [Candidatus Eremiobacteraceae bacterium]